MNQDSEISVPAWVCEVLATPGSYAPLEFVQGALQDSAGKQWADLADGIIRFKLPGVDPSIQYYESIGGTRFAERSSVAYAMSSLDTPVYHEYLRSIAPTDPEALIVDVGGGDGRNTEPWLQWGYRRIVLIDPVRASLLRFRKRVLTTAPEWWDRIALIQADARQLPLIGSCAERVLAIETVSYLNDDAGKAIAECFRVLVEDGELLVSDRDYEAGLLISALYYGGVAGLLALGRGRDIWDGAGNERVRNRCYTREELIAAVVQQGFRVLRVAGISGISLILGFLRGHDRLGDDAAARLPEIRSLLSHLAEHGTFVRAHVVIASRASDSVDGVRTVNRKELS